MRYQFKLTPCDGTAKSCWGKVLQSANSILALWDLVGWRESLSHDQGFVILDTKTGKEMSEKEYADLVNRLKGW